MPRQPAPRTHHLPALHSCIPSDRAAPRTAPPFPPYLRSQVNGLALALLLGVDGAILPPAVTRRTFNVTLDHLRDEDLWSTRPLGTLLDVERMREHWRAHHGIELQEASGAPLWRVGACLPGGCGLPASGQGGRRLLVVSPHQAPSSTAPAARTPTCPPAEQAAKTVMTSEGAPYPRPLLASARPAGEPADCAGLQLNGSEFSTLTGAAASARALLEGARQERGPGGCIILRTESLFRGFWYNRHAGLEGGSGGRAAGGCSGAQDAQPTVGEQAQQAALVQAAVPALDPPQARAPVPLPRQQRPRRRPGQRHAT